MRPKVVILHNASLRHQLFTQAYIDRIERVADLTCNQSPHNPTTDDARRMLADADVCVTSWGCPRISESILEAAPKLKLVIHAAGSVKGIVSDAMYDRGITITSAAPALAVGVAETTLGLTICSLKNVWELSNITREGRWHGPEKQRIRELYEVTIGVVGASHVGRHFMKLLQNFEVEVLCYDPVRSEEEIATYGATKVELDELLQRSDVVSIHAPSIPATHHMFNRNTFALMKDDAVLINTARGSIVNEADLIAELEKGRFWACIDVTDPEPPAADSPLRSLPNVTLIPHIAGSVNNGHRRLGRYAAEEIEHFAAGKPAINPVPREQLATLA